MGRLDRRRRTALDEAYRYYRQIENGEAEPDIYRLNQAVKTLSFALAVADVSEFKLTKQLWKRLHQALFDRLVTNFSGRLAVLTENREECEIRNDLPEKGYLQFYPDHCKRSDDVNEIELGKLFPGTYNTIRKLWLKRGAFVRPADFEGNNCEGGVCYMKPMVLGQDVLNEESKAGQLDAHNKWWELYWLAYCSNSKQEQMALTRQMSALESIWGNLYY